VYYVVSLEDIILAKIGSFDEYLTICGKNRWGKRELLGASVIS
jgi:hypothetical protein